ncbi:MULTISPECIES: TatD family hydrolase [unclassified Thermosipho (in: thermotogales)]|uniref:TatD family hydrolase n=1 Tax=unclassified Thermosipho (in: thermotogales) TaxID=2676525 RepID=UPI000985BB40|nr:MULTISPECIES: TatD family hydrolase [unclassified Thermosipho (in: thermotogales)]MBT1247978.1 hydrolase TatD [Thermosipho sp. 1244]OOC46576.1 hydrolase TatD [Thermosipho sp. 1223]
MRFVDTHAHLHMKHFDKDRKEIIEKLNDFPFLVNVATNIEDSYLSLSLAKNYKKIYATVGVHPHDSKDVSKDYLGVLEKLAKDEKVVAIGEIGLDYYRNISPFEIQQKVFTEQLILAKELNLPVVVHIRDAYEDAYNIIEMIGHFNGVIHAFSGDNEYALKFVKLGFFLGIGGPVTYKKNENLRDVVRLVGEENIVSETDCPYLPPQPFRGKRNEPGYVRFVVEEINRVLGEDVSETLVKNAAELFEVKL